MSTTDPLPSPFAHADEQMAAAPMPTARTLRQRSTVPIQLFRFAVINAKILRMVLKGHSG